jgi:hypothetical protein
MAKGKRFSPQNGALETGVHASVRRRRIIERRNEKNHIGHAFLSNFEAFWKLCPQPSVIGLRY